MKKVIGEQTRINIGFVIRDKRIQKGMSQAELSKRAHVTRTFLNLIESGKRIPSYDTVQAIASVLDEDVINLIAEAKQGNVDPGIRLAYLSAKLVKSGDPEKLAMMLNFIENLE